MGNLIVAIVVFSILSFAVIKIVLNRRRPEKKLLRDFSKVKKLVMESIDKSNKKEAKKLLLACEEHLTGLIRARTNYQTLGEMRESASQLTGKSVSSGELINFEAAIADQVAEFFANLARISTVVSLGSDKTLVKLRGFASDLEGQREALNQLFEK